MMFLLGLFFAAQVHAQAAPEAPKLEVLGNVNYIFSAPSNGIAKHTFIFQNTGLQPITRIQIMPVAIPFSIDDFENPNFNTCAMTLAAGARCTVSVTYKPSDLNSSASMLVLSYFDGNETQAAFANMGGNVN